jgi:hypothetical protein
LASLLVSLLLGAASAFPLLLETFNHVESGSGSPGRHVEAQSTVHHTDRCLLDTFHSSPGTLLSSGSAFVVRSPGRARDRVSVPPAPLVESAHRPLPRSPPANA